jgi:hypothetical protein
MEDTGEPSGQTHLNLHWKNRQHTAQDVEVMRFVTGHDFSRAASIRRKQGGL